MKLGHTAVAFLLALAFVTGTGCGEDESRPVAGTRVSMDEYSFDPKDLVVKSGEEIAISNEGAIAHNLKIEKGPDPLKKSTELAGTPTFLPKETRKLKVDLPSGKYAMVCTVSGHRGLGMTGTITVK
jgi:plastocyanin